MDDLSHAPVNGNLCNHPSTRMQKRFRQVGQTLYVQDLDGPPVNDIVDITVARVLSAVRDVWNHAPYGTGYNPQLPGHAPTTWGRAFQHDRYNKSD